MKDSIRNLHNYVLQGFVITVLLVSIKILVEHTSVGHRIELFTFKALQSTLPSFNPDEELPVAVVDISDIKEKNGQIIDLAKLKEITVAIAEQKPGAIAIDLILNPKDIAAARQDSSAQPTVQQAQEYYDFLDFCLKLKAEKNVPIFLGVGMMSGGKPEDWLGQEKYKELAATAFTKKGDTARIPVWLKAEPIAEKLFSISASLSRAYSKPQLPNGISWAIETTGEELPAMQRHLEENIEYADALINYSKLEEIRQSRLLTLSRNSVKEAGEKFRHKMVLLGDGTLDVDVFTPPGQSEPIPGVYMHACAAYTFAREPLYEVKPLVRFGADICLSLLMFGGVAIVRYRYLNGDKGFRAQQHRAVFIYLVGIVILLAAVGFVYWLGLLWLDFLLVAIALWLPPTFEKMIRWLFNRQLVPAYNKTAIILEPDNYHLKNTRPGIQQAGRRPKHKTKRTVNSHKRKILFIAANPSNASRIQTDKEHRLIKAEMERGSHRDAFEFLQPQFAVTITELLRAMNAKPNIVHFSGHGAIEGIIITTDDNQSQLLTSAILERLFKPLKDVTEIVVLNSCYSATQAESISKLGMYVVGNNLPIGDDAAISFAKGLYNGLSEGKSFKDAINDARIVVMTESPSYSTVIEVWEGGNKLNI